VTRLHDSAGLLDLAERLAAYQPCLAVDQAICDRATVDEAVVQLRKVAELHRVLHGLKL